MDIKSSPRVRRLLDGVVVHVPDARVDFHTGRGQAWPWMGEGVEKPAAFNDEYKAGNKGASSNRGKQESQPPATVMSRSRLHWSTSGGLSKSFFKEDKSPPRFFGAPLLGMENCGGGFPIREAAICACTASQASWASSGKVWADAPS